MNKGWIFWIGYGVPGIGALIWLDLKALFTIFSGKEGTVAHDVMWQ